MFNHYLATTLRNFLQQKSATVISIGGLALGLACFVAALSVVTFLTEGDKQLANAERILIVTESMHPRGTQSMDFASVRSSPPVARYLRTDFPKLEAVASVRDVQAIPVNANERLGYLRAAAADPDFFKIIRFSFIESTASNPLTVPHGAVITEETAQKLFGSTQVLGRTITLQNALDVTITGVIRLIPQPSHIGSTPKHTLRFDILFSEDTHWSMRRAVDPKLPATSPLAGDSWGSNVCFTYVLLPRDGSLSRAMLNERLDAFTRRHVAESRNRNMGIQHKAIALAGLPLALLDVELFHGNGLSLAPLILALAGIVLVVACVNYANLCVAQVLTRAREIGLRRALGANALQIATQQWLESAVHVIVAFLLAAPLVPFIFAAMGDEFSGLVTVVAVSSSFWISLLAVTSAIVFSLGAYVAIVLVRALPIRALQGSSVQAGTGFVARLLIGIQFATASALLIGLIVVQRQNQAIREASLHPTSDPIVVLQFPGREASVKFEILKEKLLRSPAIKSISGIARSPWSTKQASITSVSVEPGGTLRNALVDFVRFDFERATAVPLLAGRSFDVRFNDAVWAPEKAKANDNFPIVLDRMTARELGWVNPADAVNKTVYWPSFDGAQIPLRVLGVTEDFPLRLDASNDARLHLYALLPAIANNFVIRIDKAKVTDALAMIDETWKDLIPYTPVQRRFLDDLFEREYRTLQRVGDIVTAMTVVGTLIAAMGLFGMATFTATRRRREIGVRKTLGASVAQIVSMLLRDFSKPVLIANILVWPLAYLVSRRYLDMLVQRVDLTPVPFVLSLVLTLIVAWVAVGGHAWRAARLKPSDVLRSE